MKLASAIRVITKPIAMAGQGGPRLYMIFGHVFGSSASFLDSNEPEILIPVEFNMADRTVIVV